MITVFILLTGEWIDAMEPAAAIEGAVSSIFFIGVVLIGKCDAPGCLAGPHLLRPWMFRAAVTGRARALT